MKELANQVKEHPKEITKLKKKLINLIDNEKIFSVHAFILLNIGLGTTGQ